MRNSKTPWYMYVPRAPHVYYNSEDTNAVKIKLPNINAEDTEKIKFTELLYSRVINGTHQVQIYPQFDIKIEDKIQTTNRDQPSVLFYDKTSESIFVGTYSGTIYQYHNNTILKRIITNHISAITAISVLHNHLFSCDLNGNFCKYFYVEKKLKYKFKIEDNDTLLSILHIKNYIICGTKNGDIVCIDHNEQNYSIVKNIHRSAVNCLEYINQDGLAFPKLWSYDDTGLIVNSTLYINERNKIVYKIYQDRVDFIIHVNFYIDTSVKIQNMIFTENDKFLIYSQQGEITVCNYTAMTLCRYSDNQNWIQSSVKVGGNLSIYSVNEGYISLFQTSGTVSNPQKISHTPIQCICMIGNVQTCPQPNDNGQTCPQPNDNGQTCPQPNDNGDPTNKMHEFRIWVASSQDISIRKWIITEC